MSAVSIIEPIAQEYALWDRAKCDRLMSTIAALRDARHDDGEGVEVIELRVPQWLTPSIHRDFGVEYVRPSDSMVCETVAIAA